MFKDRSKHQPHQWGWSQSSCRSVRVSGSLTGSSLWAENLKSLLTSAGGLTQQSSSTPAALTWFVPHSSRAEGTVHLCSREGGGQEQEAVRRFYLNVSDTELHWNKCFGWFSFTFLKKDFKLWSDGGRGGCCRATDAGGEIRRDQRRKYLTCLSSSAGSRQIIQVVISQTTSTPSVRTLPKDELFLIIDC